jgi:hypothetical protein
MLLREDARSNPAPVSKASKCLAKLLAKKAPYAGSFRRLQGDDGQQLGQASWRRGRSNCITAERSDGRTAF